MVEPEAPAAKAPELYACIHILITSFCQYLKLVQVSKSNVKLTMCCYKFYI